MTALADELARARAQAAARRGELEAAARMTDGDGGVAALDLRARIHAQRGELDAADECWAQVQAMAPEDASAAAGRAIIADIRAGRRPPRPPLRPATLAAGATGLALAATTALLAYRGFRRR